MADRLKKPKNYKRGHCLEFERICREERDAGETVVVKKCCQRDMSHALPCLADIMVLAGLELPCEACAPNVQRMRDLDGWQRHPATHGTFYTCERIHPQQKLLISHRIGQADFRNWENDPDGDSGYNPPPAP